MGNAFAFELEPVSGDRRKKYCTERFAAVPLQLQLEFAGRFRWLIGLGNLLLTLGHQQEKGQETPIAIMQR